MFMSLADGLAHEGFAVATGFLDAALCASLSREIDELAAEGALRAAAIGRQRSRRDGGTLRSDEIAWLEAERASPPQAQLLAHLDQLRCFLNQELYLGLREVEAHLALYKVGTRYARHVDRHRDSDARVVSCVVYLNDVWAADWGGALRIYDPKDPSRVACDVVPCAGTVACFLSDTVEHEVLPTKAPRKSVAAWLRR